MNSKCPRCASENTTTGTQSHEDEVGWGFNIHLEGRNIGQEPRDKDFFFQVCFCVNCGLLFPVLEDGGVVK